VKTKHDTILRTPAQPMTTGAFANHMRVTVAHHGERILAEIPRTLRRVSLLLLVLTITVPVFLAALLVVLWHAGS
jgi:hypothetical protein